MAIFSERKILHAKSVLFNLNEGERREMQEHLKTENIPSNERRGLFKLPAEIRNRIYHYVAEDAHAAVIVPKKVSSVDDITRALALRESDGNKVRPGLLGTCRKIFIEFHSIFYSPRFVEARFWGNNANDDVVNHPAMLDALVNGKHHLHTSEWDIDVSRLTKSAYEQPKYERVATGYRNVSISSGDTRSRPFSMRLCAPWHGSVLGSPKKSRPSCTCFDMATSHQVPSKEDRCTLCIINMGPERVVSEKEMYFDWRAYHGVGMSR